jgi:glycosyltransferase involved in cell wall biosynthesis/2-polyprenyl-3-methyl-5-hydroxy-6-metoxy-1,4-benzoquinol methylase
VSFHKYDNSVQPDNKYGHTLELLRKHIGSVPPGGVHLDVACGFGHIAEPLIDMFGLTYVGVDIEADFIKELVERGHEGHIADLTSTALTEEFRRIIDGRELVSVTFLDGLEHMTDGSHVLRAIGDVLAEHRAIAVTSVPNVTHLDIALKNLLGHWTYTEAGLLDRTHYQLYSRASLEEAFAGAGLNRIDSNDVVLGKSDQHFPGDHAILSEKTSVSHFLRGIRDTAEPNGLVNQFVWALGPVRPLEAVVEEPVDEPFLSVLIRTQGRRPQELREAFLSLAAQSNQDFEILVIAHRTSIEQQKTIERVIADQPPALQERTRLLRIDRGKRSTPLNFGLEHARGRYVSIFDDDDIVLGHWVEEFAKAERDFGGRILRSVALRQNVTVIDVLGADGVRATSAPKPVYEATFSLARHVARNESPPIGWVFPRSLHRDFGLTFDESMTTTEDWEFLLQAAQIVGVTDVSRVGAIYRWWIDRDSSRTVHPRDEWLQNELEVRRRIDAKPFLLPAGDTRQLRKDLQRLSELERVVKRQRLELKELKGERGSRRLRPASPRRRPVSLARKVARKSLTAARNPRLVRQRLAEAIRRRRRA